MKEKVETALMIGEDGAVSIEPWKPDAQKAQEPLALRKTKRGQSRVYLKPGAETARTEGPISVEGSGAHVANNHNARLMRDVPLLVNAGLVPLMTIKEGTVRAEKIRQDSKASFETWKVNRIAKALEVEQETVAEFGEVGRRLVALMRHMMPLEAVPAAVAIHAKKLRAGRMPRVLKDPRHWLPKCVCVVGETGDPILILQSWQGYVEVMGSARDPEVRKRVDEEVSAGFALVDVCGPILEDPLKPTMGWRGIRRRHLRVLRHLMEPVQLTA